MSTRINNKFQHFLDHDIVRIPRTLIELRVNIHAHLVRAKRDLPDPWDPSPLHLEELTSIIAAKPEKHLFHREMWNYNSRLASLIQSQILSGLSRNVLEDIAKAGFFYKDTVLACAHCGNHLNSWTPGDNPWERHAELKQRCPFLKRNCRISSSGVSTSV